MAQQIVPHNSRQFPMALARACTLTILSALGVLTVPSSLSAEGAKDRALFRARVTKITPEQPARIHWRWGGGGLGGQPVRGELTRFLPSQPEQPNVEGETSKTEEFATEGLEIDKKKKPTDRIITEDETYNYEYLKPGTWSRLFPLSEFKRTRGRLFSTFTLQGLQTGTQIQSAELELEFSYRGKALKNFTVPGSDGPTFGVVIPFYRLGKGGEPTPEFVSEVGDLRAYAEWKAEALRTMPWIGKPVPKRYGVLTDCAGYKPGSGYGCRTADKSTILAEYAVLRLMGMNGTRGCPAFIHEMIRKGDGLGKELGRIHLSRATGYPINCVHYADGRAPTRHPGDGCPYYPENVKNIGPRCQSAVDRLLDTFRDSALEEVWGLTNDEIGTVFDGAPERKAHQGCCPYCRKGFHELVKSDGKGLKDFGAPSWDDIRSTYGYWAISFWESKRQLEEFVAKAKKIMEADTKGSLTIDSEDLLGGKGGGDDEGMEEVESDLEVDEKTRKDTAKQLIEAEARLKSLIWTSRVEYIPPDKREDRLPPEGWDLLHYYSRRFNCEAAAKLFDPLREVFDAANEEKRQALARGETNSPEARQPWLYSFALRGNTFLMGGHSLGFFDFYQYADNAFVYETSNRDRRIWQWDSYLCDVGRSLSRFRGKRFGIYVKPHRGAPVQRALTAVARGTRMIYWYTYGPDWSKGDTWGGRIPILQKIAWVSRLIAQAEDVTHDSDWAVPAEVAIVRPRTAEFFSGSASWENGKWIYTALMHAHIPVDPMDEWLLLSEDLSRYKVIIICGDHVRRDVAEKLKRWVEDGGTLYTCGWGMAADEGKRPLDLLLPVFGLRSRNKMEMWGTVPRYGATSLRAIRQKEKPPEGAEVTGKAPLRGSFVPEVGRQVLDPVDDAEVVATYADGSAAAVRHRYGEGSAWLIGTYAGMEYAFETMHNKPFNGDKRTFVAAPVLAAGVQPVVDASEPLVEGVLLKNKKTGKQAVVLMNWKFRIDQEVTIKVRGSPGITKARSVALDGPVPLSAEGDAVVVTLPKMDEGDILLLE